MNPLFNKPQFQKMGQVLNDVRMLQQNPGQIGQYLSDHGMISKDQIADFNRMPPSQIGQYLVQNGTMPQQNVQRAYQDIVPTIQQRM